MGLISRVSSRTYRNLVNLLDHLRKWASISDATLAALSSTPSTRSPSPPASGTSSSLSWPSALTSAGVPRDFDSLLSHVRVASLATPLLSSPSSSKNQFDSPGSCCQLHPNNLLSQVKMDV